MNAAVRDEVDMIQVREKDLEARALYELVCRFEMLLPEPQQKFSLTTGWISPWLRTSTEFICPEMDCRQRRVRPFVRLLGCSTHTLDETVQAERDGADFVIFGPVFETPGKTPVGLDTLRQVTESVRIPVLAIGGITRENTEDVLKAGAAGIAAIRLFQQG